MVRLLFRQFQLSGNIFPTEGLVTIMVILVSRKFGVNPDNVATPVAGSLGKWVKLLNLKLGVKGLSVTQLNFQAI